MKINIVASNPSVSRKELRYVASFFGNILLGKRLSNNIHLIIKHVYLDEEVVGYCYPADKKTGRHRKFIIELDHSANYQTQIETLAHEMVHLKQYARGELRNMRGEFVKWRGRKYRTFETAKYTEKYANRPWEKEAFLSEPWLAGFYKQHCRNNGLEW